MKSLIQNFEDKKIPVLAKRSFMVFQALPNSVADSKTILVSLLGILGCTQSLFGEIPEGYLGTRPAGMGGAFTAVANDESSFFTNPAGISRIRKARSRKGVHLTLFPNATVGFNSGASNLYTTLKSATGTDVAEAIAAANIVSDKPFYVRGASFPAILFEGGKNFPVGVGFVGNSISKIYIDKDLPTDARIVSVTDAGGAVGFAFTNFENRLNLGISIRPTYRYAYEDTVPTSELKESTALAKRMKQSSNSGFGLGVDAGLMFTLADFWFPTLGLAIRNLPTGCQTDYLNPFTEERQSVCGTVYSSKDGNPDALSNVDPMDLRVGFSISPRIAREFGVRFAADLHNLYLTSGTTYYGLPGIDSGKLIHGGIEFFSGNPLEQSGFSARIGASQGFVSYGASFHAPFFHLEFASYGVDVSDKATKVEDRRYLGTAGFAF
jgi:hypothetical protein